MKESVFFSPSYILRLMPVICQYLSSFQVIIFDKITDYLTIFQRVYVIINMILVMFFIFISATFQLKRYYDCNHKLFQKMHVMLHYKSTNIFFMRKLLIIISMGAISAFFPVVTPTERRKHCRNDYWNASGNYNRKWESLLWPEQRRRKIY